MDRTIDSSKDVMHFSEFYVFFFLIFLYVRNWPLQPFSQDFGLSSHTTHVVCVNDRFLRNFFMAGFIVPTVEWYDINAMIKLYKHSPTLLLPVDSALLCCRHLWQFYIFFCRIFTVNCRLHEQAPLGDWTTRILKNMEHQLHDQRELQCNHNWPYLA